MQIKFLSLTVVAALFSTGAFAADSATLVERHDAVPSSPAPAIAQAAIPAPSQTVYTANLPSANDLVNAAAGQGLTVDRIEQSNNQILAVYRTSAGQIYSVSYQTLPPSSAPATMVSQSAPGVVTTSGSPVVVYQSTPAVVYQTTPSVVYYDPPYRYSYSYPYWYPPVSLSLGFGWGYWGGHGYYRGGYHGGYHGYHHR